MTEIETKMEEGSTKGSLRDEALKGFLQAIMSFFITIVFLVIVGVIWGQRRAKKLIRQMSPQHAAGRMIYGDEQEESKEGEGKKPGGR